MAQEFLPGPVFDLAQFSQPEKIIFYKTYLGQALFHNCDVSKLNFSLVVWRRRRGSGKWKVFEEEVDLDAAPDLTAAAGSVDERRYWLVVELYQQLKKNYDERKDYATAGDFHYGEMEMKRLATPHAEWHARLINRLRMRRSGAWEFVILTSRLVALVRRWWHRHLSLVAWYKYASQYGESYVRPAIWLGVTLLLFALLYPAVGLRYDQAKDRVAAVAVSTPAVTLSYDTPLFPGQPAADRHKAQWELFWNSCLTSVEIAAFQKEPAYQPVYPRGRLLTLTETLLTSTLAALFFLALRRQFRR